LKKENKILKTGHKGEDCFPLVLTGAKKKGGKPFSSTRKFIIYNFQRFVKEGL
jgi:hypothetical protein